MAMTMVVCALILFIGFTDLADSDGRSKVSSNTTTNDQRSTNHTVTDKNNISNIRSRHIPKPTRYDNIILGLPILKNKTRVMFQIAYDSYMKHAFPLDELNPIDCKGRGVRDVIL